MQVTNKLLVATCGVVFSTYYVWYYDYIKDGMQARWGA